MVENQSKNPSARGTLIVATMSLLSQWEGEIKTRVKPGVLRVLVYYGSQRPKNVDDINSYDVVLTTYGTLVSECPKRKKRKRKTSKKSAKVKDGTDEDESDNEDNDLVLSLMSGPLFRTTWHRWAPSLNDKLLCIY
jgi:SNF2 family DNA or RNA helicase